MLLLKLAAQDLLTLNSRHRMVPHLAARWRHFRGADASESERAAWAESLVSLATELVAADRGNVEMIVECAVTLDEADRPDGPRLIDVVLVGRHPQEQHMSVQLVELKRWSTVTRVEQATADWVRTSGMDKKEHPVLQLREYYEAFTGSRGPLVGADTDFECGGFAFLHNATEDSVRPLLDVDAPTGPYAQVYTNDRREDLRSNLRKAFAEEGAASAAEKLMRGMGLRNTPLLDAMIWARGDDTVFTLRGRQKAVADQILETAANVLPDPRHPALVPDERRVVFLVTGGAGTGKSAIGLQIKAELESQGRTVKYASGSRAFNGAIQEHVGYGDREFRETFTYFSSFVTPPDPPLDVLICDEAHRLRDRSTSRFWKPEQQGTQPQVDELLNASRLTVFFLDEGQSVRPNEVGTVELIKDAAQRHGALLKPFGLREQFRCGGSDAYIRWVRALLGVSGEPDDWKPDGLMHVEVAETPEELERIIRSEALAGASARMVAGYCWPWTKPLGEEKRLEADVRIGDWHRPWNADSESFCENDAPPSRIWSVHPNGLGQIGCVYTAQGLEWDWCGVIMGDDMVRRDGRWVFRRGKERKLEDSDVKRVGLPGSFDPKVKAGSVDDAEFARLVRHAYHVLMTRASRATVLYSTDEETRRYLKKLVGKVEIHGLRPTWENLPREARVPHLPRPRARGAKRTRRNRKKPGPPEPELRLF
ncbi:DUF2075 domain-containing protein [Streptomyces sp. NBC_00390]|uniref:DUF2075 domain-containing protein n=1 Tax=Streptomyces sp. NBC_00390 TaxID=2975736 RepID=UPI002E22852A